MQIFVKTLTGKVCVLPCNLVLFIMGYKALQACKRKAGSERLELCLVWLSCCTARTTLGAIVAIFQTITLDVEAADTIENVKQKIQVCEHTLVDLAKRLAGTGWLAASQCCSAMHAAWCSLPLPDKWYTQYV